MASRKRKIAELSKIFSEMTIEEREKYKRTPAQRQEAADNRQRDQEAKAAYLRNMYKKNTNKKAGGKVGSKNKDPYGERTRGTNEQAERAAAAEKEQMEKFIEAELNNNRGRMNRD